MDETVRGYIELTDQSKNFKYFIVQLSPTGQSLQEVNHNDYFKELSAEIARPVINLVLDAVAIDIASTYSKMSKLKQ